MRAHEFIFEAIEDVIEDEADSRGDNNLADVLETLRNRAHDTHDVPMVRVDSLINMIRNMPGTEMFTIENLLDAYKSNEKIKNLVKDIKDNKDGIKYVYLTTFADDPDSNDLDQVPRTVTDPEKTIDSMAKRALSKRS
jgi:ERCC4-type nuclease